MAARHPSDNPLTDFFASTVAPDVLRKCSVVYPTDAKNPGGLKKTPHRALAQVASEGYRIKASILQEVLPSTPMLHILLTRYALVQGNATGANSGLQPLTWFGTAHGALLLMLQDRVNSHILMTTHERLATLLGTDRPSVSLVASRFQKQGLIEYRQGIVRVLNRRKLKESACECYEVIHEYYSQLGLK